MELTLINAQKVIQRELDSGEKLVWAGVPQQGIVLRKSDVFVIPFSLVWGGFAIFWEIMALSISIEESGSIGYIFPVFGVPLVVIGLYVVFGRFIYDAKKREKTFYGITNERVIIISGVFNKEVKSFHLSTLTDISLSEEKDLFGTITFGQDNRMATLLVGHSPPSAIGGNAPKFELIDHAKTVYNKLCAQQKACKTC